MILFIFFLKKGHKGQYANQIGSVEKTQKWVSLLWIDVEVESAIALINFVVNGVRFEKLFVPQSD